MGLREIRTSTSKRGQWSEGFDKIEARPRRPIPEGIASETTRSEHYFELLTKLGYAHHPDS